jgi:hypothetical protein
MCAMCRPELGHLAQSDRSKRPHASANWCQAGIEFGVRDGFAELRGTLESGGRFSADFVYTFTTAECGRLGSREMR